MSKDNQRLKINSKLWKSFAFLAFFTGGAFLSPAWAQFSGGDETSGSAESSIGTDIFDGGAQNNTPFGTSQ